MRPKRWLAAAMMAVVLAICWIGLNILVDPFGVFGDRLYQWYGYNMTENPAVAKISYLERSDAAYDTYILGGEAAGAYPVDQFNEIFRVQCYNLSLDVCKPEQYREMAEYVVRQRGAKNLILSLGLQETAEQDSSGETHPKLTGENMAGFYLRYALSSPRYSLAKLEARKTDTVLPQSFDRWLPETGCLDYRDRDVEKVGDPEVYMLNHGMDFSEVPGKLGYNPEYVSMVEKIAELCAEYNVSLTVILEPEYISRWEKCDVSALEQFRENLAQVTEYWDFGVSTISKDSRYFYDGSHFRSAVGEMMLEKVFGLPSGCCPEDFGRLTTKDNVGTQETPTEVRAYTENVPVLMYHHLDQQGNDATIISEDSFERQLRLMTEAGYHTVSMKQLVDYVYEGTPLPENPVCITFDDGYQSNYEIAYPMLEKYQMQGTIFAVGSSVGCSTYKDTDYAIYPHFSYSQAVEMMESGVINVQSHTYDMHQWAPYETVDQPRESAMPLEGEGEQNYIAALGSDLDTYARAYSEATGRELYALAYPNGRFETLTEVVVHDAGILVTMSVDTNCRNTLVKGLPQSLYALCRLNVSEATTDEELLAYLSNG